MAGNLSLWLQVPHLKSAALAQGHIAAAACGLAHPLLPILPVCDCAPGCVASLPGSTDTVDGCLWWLALLLMLGKSGTIYVCCLNYNRLNIVIIIIITIISHQIKILPPGIIKTHCISLPHSQMCHDSCHQACLDSYQN